MPLHKKILGAIPGVGPLVSTGLDIAGSLFGKRSNDQAGEAAREAEIATAKLGVEQSEDSRVAHAGLAGGVDFEALGFQGLDPGLAEQLGVRRNYDPLIEAGARDRTAGSGSAFLSGLTDLAGDAFAEHDLGQDPVVAAGSVGTASDPALQGLPADLDELDRVG